MSRHVPVPLVVRSTVASWITTSVAVPGELDVELEELGAQLERAHERRQGVLRAMGGVAAVGDDERGHGVSEKLR